MSAPGVPGGFAPSGFFALRTPLLPIDELRAWGRDLRAPEATGAQLEEAWRGDVERLRERLRALVRRPEIEEALWLGSPSLHAALEHWRQAPDSARGRRCEQALVRYVTRLCARPTPFGLFAGTSLGVFADADDAGGVRVARLELPPRARYTRRTRLDCDYVYALADALASVPEVRDALPVRPNSSLHRRAGRWHYVEVRHSTGRRSHHLVALDAAPHLDFSLARAADGARPDELAEALWRHLDDAEVSLQDAREFVAGLIDEQVLVSELTPPLTAPDALDALLDALAQVPARDAAAARGFDALRAARRGLAELDRRGPGRPPQAYAQLAQGLKELPVKVEPSRLVQVDLWKPADGARLGHELADELRRGVLTLHRLYRPREGGALQHFREAFVERYGEGREVPLLDALDDECGVGFEHPPSASADTSPLLAGLALDPARAAQAAPFTSREAWLLRRLDTLRARGERELRLDAADVQALAPETPPPPLPGAFHVMAAIAAGSPEALEAGRFRLWIQHAAGPSGARLLARFCHLEPELRARIEEHLRAEEALDPEADHAELVHLPEERTGNVLARPVLRGFEIPYLGRSAAPPERRIAVSDLLVSVVGGEIRLRSTRSGRRVVPRLTAAHVFEHGLSVYRFLGLLQAQRTAGGVFWSWGALESASFLPRVSFGRLVFARARWRVERAELEPWAQLDGAARFAAARRWREERGLPRHASLVEGSDRELPVDFDNALSIEAFLGAARTLREAQVLEPFPPPDEHVVCGPEGVYAHELVVPFVGLPLPAPRAGAPRRAPRGAGAVPRAFAPGSEWLYAKVYAGPATAERLLVDPLAGMLHELRARGIIDRWFFVRYGDPRWHLRLRLHGAPARLWSEGLAALHAALEQPLREGRVHKLQLDTYERELERYGGAAAIAACERLFEADSEAVLELLAQLPRAAEDARWQWALLGLDAQLGELGLGPAARARLVSEAQAWTERELKVAKPARLQIDRRFRARRAELERLFERWSAGVAGDDPVLAPARRAFARRAQRAAEALAELRGLEASGELERPLTALAASLMHMHVNRLARSAGQAHELLLYDFLARLLAGAAARAARAGLRA